MNISKINRYFTYAVAVIALPLGCAAFVIELDKHNSLNDMVKESQQPTLEWLETKNAIFDTADDLDTIKVTLNSIDNKLDSLK